MYDKRRQDISVLFGKEGFEGACLVQYLDPVIDTQEIHTQEGDAPSCI